MIETGCHVRIARVESLVGADMAARLRDVSVRIYTFARDLASERGLILADTKFEFGLRPDGTLVLADEVLTPDSSRFWDARTWQPGRSAPSFDKQYVRDWLRAESGWAPGGNAPPPPLPDEVVSRTRSKYIQAYEKITGEEYR